MPGPAPHTADGTPGPKWDVAAARLSGACLAELRLLALTYSQRESGLRVAGLAFSASPVEEGPASSGGEVSKYRKGNKDPRWPQGMTMAILPPRSKGIKSHF